MRIFDLGFSKIQDIVDQCADVVVESATQYGIIGFLSGLTLILAFFFVPFLKPKRRFFKVMNLFNLIYFPSLFAVVFGIYGGIHAADKFSENQIKETVVPLTKMAFPAFQIYLATEVNVKDPNVTLESSISEFAGVINFKPKDDSWFEEQKADIANSQVPKSIGWGIQAVVDAEINERGYENVRRIEVANHMSFLKLKYSFWRDVEARTQAYADHYFMQQYTKWFFLTLGMASLLFFQIMVVLFRPGNK